MTQPTTEYPTTSKLPAPRAGWCLINDLPFDVLHKVFWHAKEGQEEDGSRDMPVVISHVCPLWRQYMFDIPTMWTNIFFRRRGQSIDQWGRQIAYLERSRNAPLDISIWSANGRHTSLRIFRIEIILSIVTPHLHRCRSLQICLKPKGIRLLSNQFTPRSMPALEKLDLEVWNWFSMFVGWRCRIRSASLAGLRSWKTDIQLLPLMSFVPHMDNLKTLHLTSVILSPRFAERCAGTLQEILYILSRSPNLEQFTMTLRRPLRSCPSSFSAPTPVSLPHLISLEVITNDTRNEPTIYALPILESIHAPELEIIGSGGICSNIIPLIASSNPFPALKDLTLSHQRWPDNEMGLDQIESLVIQLAFSNLPLLTSLRLKRQLLTSQIIQILKNSFPRLITLSLSLCRFKPSELIEMVKARTTPAILTKLEILKIKATAVVTLSEKDQHTLHKTLPEFVYMPPDGKYPVQTQRRD